MVLFLAFDILPGGVEIVCADAEPTVSGLPLKLRRALFVHPLRGATFQLAKEIGILDAFCAA